jgi:hypothetical protein
MALVAGAVLATAGSLATTSTADAETQNRATPHVSAHSTMSPDASWKWYRDYATYEACADEGDALVGADIIITYECD